MSVSILNSHGAPGGGDVGSCWQDGEAPERVLEALANFFYWWRVETFEAVGFPRLPQLEDTGWSLRLPSLTTSGSRPWSLHSPLFFTQDFLLLLGKSDLSLFFSAQFLGDLPGGASCLIQPAPPMICLLLHP